MPQIVCIGELYHLGVKGGDDSMLRERDRMKQEGTTTLDVIAALGGLHSAIFGA